MMSGGYKRSSKMGWEFLSIGWVLKPEIKNLCLQINTAGPIQNVKAWKFHALVYDIK